MRWWRVDVRTWTLLALVVSLYFVKLGAAGLVDPDEPYYALPALEMLKSGTWGVPLLHGQPWFDKPVLFYWIVLAAFRTFGVSEWAARVGSVLAGLGGVVLLALAAPPRWRRGGTHVLAAIVLATSIEYAFLARAAVTDMTLTFFLTLGFLAFARHIESRRTRHALVAGAAFGLAGLTKGPVGVLVPGVALTLYGLGTRRWRVFSPRSLLGVVAGVIVTAAPWYVYMLAMHRDLLLTVFLGHENLGRFLQPEHRQVPLFYVWVLAGGLLPWSGALPVALSRAWADWRRGDEREGEPVGTVYALAWFLGVVGIFSLSASKLASYVLPAFPPAALLIAHYWREVFASRVTGAGPRAAAMSGAAVSIAVAVVLLTLPSTARFLPPGPVPWVLSAVLATAGVLSVLAVRRGLSRTFVGVQVATTAAVVVVVVVFGLPRLDASASTRTLVRRLEDAGLADQVAGAFRVPDVSLDFYLDRPLARENDVKRLRERADGRLWIVRTGEAGAIAGDGLVVEPVMTVARRAVVRLSSVPGESP